MRLLAFLTFASLIPASGFAQSALSCIVNAAVPPTVRAGGRTELAGDLTMICTGGTPTAPAAAVPAYTLRIRAQSQIVTYDDQNYMVTGSTLASVNITSRQLTNDGLSEAILIIDEPHSELNPARPLLACTGTCAVTGASDPALTYDGSTGRPNVFQARQIAADTLEWTSIPIDPPGPNATRVLRITNVRINANQIPVNILPFAFYAFYPNVFLFSPTLTSSTGSIPISGDSGGAAPIVGASVVAFQQLELSYFSSVSSSPLSLRQCDATNPQLTNNPASAPATYAFWVRVREGFQSVFKRKNIASSGINATAYPASGDQNQNIPSAVFNTESAFENLGPTHDPSPNPPVYVGVNSGPVPASPAFPTAQGLINTGVADHGMRIALQFQSVPSGVSMFVPTTIQVTSQLNGLVTGKAVLVATDSNGAGAFAPVADNGGSIAGYGTTTSGLAQIPVSGGQALAVYEILYSDPFNPDQFIVPVALSYASGAPAVGSTATVNLLPAPFGSSLSDALSPIPRFGPGGVQFGGTQPAFSFVSCGSTNSKLTLTSSAASLVSSDSVTFTATVTPTPAAAGNVNFFLDGILSAAALTDSTGKAKWTTQGLTNGPHIISASYTTPAPEGVLISATTQVTVVPVNVQIVAGSSLQTANVGAAFASPLAVIVTDTSTNTPRSGVPVTFTAPVSGPSLVFGNSSTSVTTVNTNSQGVASVPVTANSFVGTFSVLATAPGQSNSTLFSLTNTGTPASLTVNAGSTPQSAPVNSAFLPVSVTVKDALGHGIGGIPVYFSGPATGPSIADFQDVASTDANGVATYTLSSNAFVGGPYNVYASVAGLSPAVLSFTNLLATASKITLQPLSQSTTAFGTVTFSASAIGQPTPTVRWQVSVSGGPFTDIPGATATALTLTGVTPPMSVNQYRAVFTNSFGSVLSTPANLYVSKATPVVTWTSPANISSGTPLSATQLNATANVPGTFAYTPAAGTVLPAGDGQALSTTFTPTDSASYLNLTTSVAINVKPSTPAVTALNQTNPGGATQALTLQFSHPVGFANLGVLNVLINGTLDGRHACYLAYVQAANTVYLVNDAGDSGGPFAGGLVLNGGGAINNSQCAISGAGSSATGSGNSLTLTLNLSYTAAFGGYRVIFAAARDNAAGNSGWQTMGVHSVPPLPSGFPTALSMSPTAATGSNQTFTFTYQDAFSASNIQTVWALMNTAIDGRAACFVAYYRPGNQLFLYPDNGDGTQATKMVLTGTNSLSNSQCTISAQGSSVSVSGATLTLNLNVTLMPAFAGPKGVWMAVQTLGNQNSPWQALGSWIVAP